MKAEMEPRMLLCSHCPKEFRYNSEKKRHELSHFPRFECETCCKKFSFVSALRRHQKQHERTGSVKCKECHRKFRDDVLLKRHIKYAHKGTFICEKCNSKFSSDLALATHMKTHNPESERRFKCSYDGCTKSFNFSHHLKHHELTHTNAKQHYCCFCGKGFIQSHHLKTHLKAHDPTSGLFCKLPGCKKKFSTDYARKRHMATHKTKPDSGISSDSNSCDASITSKVELEPNKETILVPQKKYRKNLQKCSNEEQSDTTTTKEDPDDFIEEWPNSPFKPNAVKEATPKLTADRDEEDCSMMFGDIVDSENCIDSQMATPVNESYDCLPIGNNNTKNSENNNSTIEVSRNIDPANLQNHEEPNNKKDFRRVIVKVTSLTDFNQNYQIDMCEGCDCANICSDKVLMYDLTPEVSPDDGLLKKMVKKDSAAPNIEYRNDGTIKIKDTFDEDIVVQTDSNDFKRFIPFSTCKDVVGNCLVNNGDGCLCARMMADENEAIMAQEIEDITPQPKTDLL